MQNGIKSPDKEQWEINSASISFITVKTGKPCSPHNTSLKCYDHVFLCCVALIVLFYLSAQYLVVTAAPTIFFSLPYSPSSRTFILPLGIMRLHALCHSLASPSCKDRSTIRTVPSNSTDPSTITLFSIISCMKTNSEDNDPSTQCFSYTGSSTVIHMQQDNMWLPLWSYFWSS